MKRTWYAAFGAVLLLLALLVGTISAAAVGESIYFMSVNDTVLDLDDATMPRVVNGILYVPYIMFDPNYTNGENLGVFSSYSRAKGTVIIYSRTGTLVFDINADTTFYSGEEYREKAIIRNSMVFVPVDLVCKLFDLDWSWLIMDYGYIIRVKSDAVVLDDASFVDAASFVVRDRFSKYKNDQAQLTQSPTTDPTPAPSAVEPSPDTETVQPDLHETKLYLGFRMDSGEGFADLLEQLHQNQIYGIFFCPPENLADRDDDVRALLAAGHKIGLLLDAATLNAQLEQWETGQELLSHIARTDTVFCLSENLSDSDWNTLSQQVCLWRTTLDATCQEQSVRQQTRAITDSIRPKKSYFTLLDDTAQSAQVLTHVLEQLMEEGCSFPQVNEIVVSKK